VIALLDITLCYSEFGLDALQQLISYTTWKNN